MIYISKIIFILSTLLWNNLVISDVTIKIIKGMNTEYPIAVIPFSWSYCNKSNISPNIINSLGATEDISTIIKSDLKNSGQFNIVSTEYLPHQPTKISDIIPMFWEKIGINIMILGTINVNHDGNYTISYQLIDTSSNPALIILENQYLIEPKWIRYIAHTISNEIFEKLTGIKGVFCTRIAYILRKNHSQYSYELCISDYDGHNQSSICQSKEPLMSPTWSADGKKIAYVTFASGYAELIIQTLDTGQIHNIINFPNHNGAPAFSPDGEKLAFVLSKTGSLNLYIMDLKTNKIKQLTNNNNNNTEPSWFPDSKSIAYTSDQGGTPQIYKIELNTSKVQRLSWRPTNNHYPSVSSDGKFIIMVNRNQGVQNILKLNLFTGKEEILTNAFLNDTPCIAPNNTMILYSTTNKQQLHSTLELISINGRITAHLEGIVGDVRFPSWSPLSLQ